MNEQKWFSSKLRFAIIIESEGASTLNDCVFLFQATDFEAAFERAILIGESNEREYENTYGKRVNWKLAEVISLDLIGTEIRDGTQVYSEPIHLAGKNAIAYGTRLEPRRSKSKVIQTI